MMEFGDNGNSKLDVSDADLMEFLVGCNEQGHQPHQQQQPHYQEVSYSNNNANTFSTSGVQQPPPAPPTNFNVTWTVQLSNAAADATTDNAGVDMADTDDERVVERWEPGEIISEEDDGEDEGDGDDAKGGGVVREDFLGRRTRSSIRRRRRRRRERQSAQVRWRGIELTLELAFM